MRGLDLVRAAVAGAALLAAAGCSTSVSDQLGLSKRSPDEFQVVRRAPLIIPPNANLRAPPGGATPSAPRQDATVVDARDILTGSDAGSGGVGGPRTASLEPSSSGAERALLSASPVRAEGDIRERIASEDLELARLDRRTFLYILSFQKKQFGPGNQVLDPKAEVARLKGENRPGSVVTIHTASTPLAVP
jgi:hypothetical protein